VYQRSQNGIDEHKRKKRNIFGEQNRIEIVFWIAISMDEIVLNKIKYPIFF